MRRFALICVLGAAVMSHQAQVPGSHRHEYHRKPAKWCPSDTLYDSLPPMWSALNAHLRVRVPSHRRLDISIIFNRIDSLNYHRCRLYRAVGPMDERHAALPLRLTVSRTCDGIDSVLHTSVIQRGLDPSSDDYSLKLLANRHGMSVVVGQRKELWRQDLSATLPASGDMIWLCDSEAALVRRSLAVEAAEPASYSRFASLSELDAYLRLSSDVNEGYWIYFDRETDLRMFSVGGDYRLATVRAADGRGYEIVYLGGARSNASAWVPMQIKGYLRPTGFIGHFDLEWIDAAGVIHKRETSADITDGASLTLFFPMYKSKVRYRRTAGITGL